MGAVVAKLIIEDRVERELSYVEMDYRRGTRWYGMPCTPPMGGLITVAFTSQRDDDYFLDWMFANRIGNKNVAHIHQFYTIKKGAVVFYEDDYDGVILDRYRFEDCTPIYYREVFSNLHGMVVIMTLSAAIQKYRFQLFVKQWHESWRPPEEYKTPVYEIKEEPNLLVTSVKGPKELNLGEKGIYKVTSFNKAAIKQDKARVKWVIKRGDKIENLPQQGVEIEYTPKKEKIGEEFILMPYLVKYDEKVSIKTKVLEEHLSLYFDGKFLVFKIVEKDKILKFSYKAVSGRPLENGKFDYSKKRQKMKREGPLPEGDKYYINPQEIQYSKNRADFDKIIGVVGRGTMPGGEYSWGKGRIWIKPSQVYVDGVLRDNFSIHGGEDAGSAGCIDLVHNDDDFFQKIEKYRGKTTKIKLIVNYQKR